MFSGTILLSFDVLIGAIVVVVMLLDVATEHWGNPFHHFHYEFEDAFYHTGGRCSVPASEPLAGAEPGGNDVIGRPDRAATHHEAPGLILVTSDLG